MSKRTEYASAAVGFVAGVGLALLFLVWAFPGFRNPADQDIRNISTYHVNAQEKANKQSQKPQWRKWGERLIVMEDSPAQWLMAFFSVIATGISIWAIRLVSATFQVTREGNLIARDIGEAQVIAYLSEEKTFFEWGNNHDPKFRASHVWKNSGQSPAFNCLAFIDHVIVEFDEADQFIRSFTNHPSSQRVGHSCASGQSVNLEGQFISKIDINDLANKKKKLILYSAVAYTDVFKNKHLAESCHVAIFPDDGDAEKILFRAYRYHNGYTDVKS
jgi:hypothetical protein